MNVTEINEPGITGLFAQPDGAGPWPAVVALAGSSGGLGPTVGWAPALASDGIAVLAVAYFGAPGLPMALLDIEVEVVERAAEWLIEHGHAAGPTVAAMGISRGSELALLSGALSDTVGPVVALAPSGISWSALGAQGPIEGPAWRFRGKSLPYAVTSGILPAPKADGAIALRSLFEPTLDDPARWRDAEIPVERATGPILLVSGEADEMWPSTPMAELIERRTQRCGFTHPVTHLHYPDAGHASAGVPDYTAETVVNHPLTGDTYALGGTPEGNAKARADSWPRIVEFLRQQV